MAGHTTSPTSPPPSGLPVAPKRDTLAQRQIDFVSAIADSTTQPVRWGGRIEVDAPACCAFGLISAASVRWVEAAVRHPRVRMIDVSIEAMGAFAAIEASIATRRPQIVICGSGPGTLGVLWAIPAARAQGASLLVLAPRTPPPLAGTTDIQESSYFSMPHTVGSELYDATFPLNDVREMPRIAVALSHLFARPQGAVVQLSVPTDLLDRRCRKLLDPTSFTIAPAAPGAAALAQIAEWLQRPGGPPAFVLGSGSVAYGEKLGELIIRMGAVHITTPAALGLLPDSLGLIGTASEADLAARLRAVGPRCVFVVGTRLGTASGGGDTALLPQGCPVVHVDAAPYEAIGSAPAVRGHPLLSVTSEIGEFLGGLDALLPSA